MQVPEEPRVRRSQRDYSLPFKLAVVGEVARGELSYKQAQRRYGIQGRSTVLAWCRKHATHFATFQQAGPTSPGVSPPVELTPEQRIKQLETQLREQQRRYEQQLRDEREKNLLLRTMLQVVEEDHSISLPKKSFRRPFAACKPSGT
jgi:transposase-like protein